MRDVAVLARIWLVRLGFAMGSFLPVRRRVVLATSHADRPGGNLAAIADGLRRWAPDLEVVVLAHRATGGVSGRVTGAIHGMRAGYHLARARLFVVDDYFFPIYPIRPRGGTRIVQVWHASGAFKRFGYSLAGKTFGADDVLLRHVRIHANYDLCLISSASVAPAYAEAFDQPIERFTSEIGVPRTDPFFDPEWRESTAAAVRQRYRVPEGRTVVLYAPTFRGTRVDRARAAGLLDLARLRAIIGADHVVLVRLHPFVRASDWMAPSLEGFAIDVSDHPEIGDLMLVSDHLVTDYSSAIFEFSLLGRPISFFAPDLEAYERERGFYLAWPDDLPGPAFAETDSLGAHLLGGAFDLEAVDRLRRASFDVADGSATRRFVERVVQPAMERES
jgi:CDP-ribitol ribitolphosphotransferase